MSEIRNLRAFLDDKKGIIVDHLSNFPPTVIIPGSGGVHVFASEIEKVHSTIVVAGAGSDTVLLAGFFRDQISKLREHWADNVPQAEIEGKILASAFRANTSPNEKILYADVVLIELKPDFGGDTINHFNFLGDKEKLLAETPQWLTYRALELDVKEDKREAERRLVEELKKYGLRKNDLETDETILGNLRGKYPGKACFMNRAKLNERNFYHVFEHFI